MALAGGTGTNPATAEVPRAVKVARTTEIPDCTVFVDAAASRPRRRHGAEPAPDDRRRGRGRPQRRRHLRRGGHLRREAVTPGEKAFTLAGGFQRGKDFKVRDSAAYVSKAKGNGGSFIRIEDPGPKGNQLTAIDGFEITGYSQAIFRDFYYSQRFDITNNHIHDNRCAQRRSPAPGLPSTTSRAASRAT